MAGMASGVAGVQAPAFVERPIDDDRPIHVTRVAGVQAPAFVERPMQIRLLVPVQEVSPGFRPRPSLSVDPHTCWQ